MKKELKEIICYQTTWAERDIPLIIVYYDNYREVEGVKVNEFGRLIWLLEDAFTNTGNGKTLPKGAKA